MSDTYEMTDRQRDQYLRVGWAVREAYTKARQRAKSGFRMSREKYEDDAFWTRVGCRVTHTPNLSPEGWVEFLFRKYYPKVPEVNFLNLRAMPEEVSENEQRAIAKAKDFIRLETNLLRGHMESGRSLREILLDHHLYLDALFRFCVAKEAGLDDVAATFEPAARATFEKFPFYEQLLSRMKEGVACLKN